MVHGMWRCMLPEPLPHASIPGERIEHIHRFGATAFAAQRPAPRELIVDLDRAGGSTQPAFEDDVDPLGETLAERHDTAGATGIPGAAGRARIARGDADLVETEALCDLLLQRAGADVG